MAANWLGPCYYGFLYLPIGVLVVISFNDSPILSLPLKGIMLDWYARAFQDTAFDRRW